MSVTAKATENGILISWTSTPHDCMAEIHAATSSGGTFSQVGETKGSSWLHELTGGTTRYYKVRFRRRNTTGSFSSEVTTKSIGLTVAGSDTRLADPRNANQVFCSNTGGTLSVQPLTAADVGATATITVAAFIVYAGSVSASYDAGSITGLAFSTVYYVYTDDANLAGGAATYSATTSRLTPAQANARVYVGKITTPADGAGGTGGGGGGGDPCVVQEAFLSNGTPASAVENGDGIAVLDGLGVGVEPIWMAGRTVDAECVRLTTESGITLTLSSDTPVPVNACDAFPASAVLGEQVAVLDGDEFRWETVTEVEPVGVRTVRRISFGGKSFAAGDQQGRYIMSHNVEKP